MRKIFTLFALFTAIIFSMSSISNASDRAERLSATNWQGTTVLTEDGTDVTSLNSGFIGLAKYDLKSNRYEFFDKKTKQTRGDMGVYFVTQDGKYRVLVSETKGYHVVVPITLLSKKHFEYSRMGKISENETALVFVDHIPYGGKLEFTTKLPKYSKETGAINSRKSGIDILGATLWQGTVVLDEKGKDVSMYNGNFLGLAKYEASTNKYEFFNNRTGESRGDFGYYDVIRENKVRIIVSVGKNYATILELTELNKDKFTYTRKGKDANGNEINVTVEHVPYTGSLQPAFSF